MPLFYNRLWAYLHAATIQGTAINQENLVVTFAVDFVWLAAEFHAFAVELVPFAVQFVTLAIYKFWRNNQYG